MKIWTNTNDYTITLCLVVGSIFCIFTARVERPTTHSWKIIIGVDISENIVDATNSFRPKKVLCFWLECAPILRLRIANFYLNKNCAHQFLGSALYNAIFFTGYILRSMSNPLAFIGQHNQIFQYKYTQNVLCIHVGQSALINGK
jgi:hypothetical protein